MAEVENYKECLGINTCSDQSFRPKDSRSRIVIPPVGDPRTRLSLPGWSVAVEALGHLSAPVRYVDVARVIGLISFDYPDIWGRLRQEPESLEHLRG